MARQQAEEPVRGALDEKSDLNFLGGVNGKNTPERGFINHGGVAADKQATVELQRLGRRIQILGIGDRGREGRQEFEEERGQVDEQNEEAAQQRQFVLAEFPPHQFPFWRDENGRVYVGVRRVF